MKTPVLESLFNKVAGLKTLTQVFSCEYCEILKNTFFIEHMRSLLLSSTTNAFFIILGEGYFVWVDVEGKKGLYLIFCQHEPEFKTLKKVRSNLNFLKF